MSAPDFNREFFVECARRGNAAQAVRRRQAEDDEKMALGFEDDFDPALKARWDATMARHFG